MEQYTVNSIHQVNEIPIRHLSWHGPRGYEHCGSFCSGNASSQAFQPHHKRLSFGCGCPWFRGDHRGLPPGIRSHTTALHS